jgi:hypothetical protein
VLSGVKVTRYGNTATMLPVTPLWTSVEEVELLLYKDCFSLRGFCARVHFISLPRVIVRIIPQLLSTTSVMDSITQNSTPYRQIRATFDAETITVYQAYNTEIAQTAVAFQKLDASPLYRSRMTWIKPSWAWMMYRSGYSYKDKGQSRILAIKMSREGFLELLKRAQLSHGPVTKTNEDGQATVRVQWDPERTVKLEKLPYRSIQIGIPGTLTEKWIEEWIVAIEDVTQTAQDLKAAIDKRPGISLDQLAREGLILEERPFDVPIDIQERLQMNSPTESET